MPAAAFSCQSSIIIMIMIMIMHHHHHHHHHQNGLASRRSVNMWPRMQALQMFNRLADRCGVDGAACANAGQRVENAVLNTKEVQVPARRGLQQPSPTVCCMHVCENLKHPSAERGVLRECARRLGFQKGAKKCLQAKRNGPQPLCLSRAGIPKIHCRNKMRAR